MMCSKSAAEFRKEERLTHLGVGHVTTLFRLQRF